VQELASGGRGEQADDGEDEAEKTTKKLKIKRMNNE